MNAWKLVVVTLPLLFQSSLTQQGGSSRRLPCFHKVQPPLEPSECDVFSRYRTISGRCNNLANPEWGSAGSTLRRLLPPAYQDGRGVPRGGRHPSSLPNPRWISQKNHPDSDVPDTRYTHMVMQFGQFLDHDITLTPKDEVTNCCESGEQGPDCFVISIPNPDRFYSWINSTAHCLNVLRSRRVCWEKVRQQYNDLTAFVDASNVYGSEQEHSAVLRTYRDGRLQRNSNTDQLPTREQLNVRPNVNRQRPERPDDFLAGDKRVNEQPFLTSLHIVFLREHNRIAKLLREYLPQELRKDEILYQEARRLVGAEMQNIAYGEYLPTILGVEQMRKHDLVVDEETEYDPLLDPSIFNSFATSAFRFGHSMVNGMFKLVSQHRTRSHPRNGGGGRRRDEVFWLWRLRDVFDGQSVAGSRLPLDNMIEGLITQQPQTCDAFFSTEITDHLFQKNRKRENFGEDLLAINIQRGREHGIPPYNQFRKACGLSGLTSWSNRPEEHDEGYWNKLRSVYDDVKDIDLYVGGVAERAVRGGVIGPTFACLIGRQFNRLKRGDRFFYTHGNANGLPPVAKAQILQRRLSDVLCDVTRLPNVQEWVTLQHNPNYNKYKSCRSNSNRLDVRAIADEIAGELLNGSGAAFRRSGFNERVRSSRNFGRSLVRFESGDAIERPAAEATRFFPSAKQPQRTSLRGKRTSRRIRDKFVVGDDVLSRGGFVASSYACLFGLCK